MEDNKHRRDFVLSKGHYFIQQPSEWDTSHFELGQEIRVADGAWDVQSHITVAVDDAPDLMDQIADYHVLPRYTDLLEIKSKLDALVKEMDRVDRDDQRGTLGYLKDALEGIND
jgi:hypothetical protein